MFYILFLTKVIKIIFFLFLAIHKALTLAGMEKQVETMNSGHMPSSINIPWQKLADENTNTLHDQDTLKSRMLISWAYPGGASATPPPF